ncbi:SDR family oxidoreductase [Actinobacteria bacterium YIM 96077]|uniref:Dehydrogenase n=1 Tax=Phytoactinopolyspora halophila TaxID=1981511 RepID=A0A329QV32_9ACTN|nr:SDR family oxidoreductase [Phytoactinopolyspora halophila]AYY15002.1 SDR family oxidoreductase [Actinobacteria bacterium YIM 96077]RAW15459.1 dehydrogenase [Phytoactinopolyspora halophila]
MTTAQGQSEATTGMLAGRRAVVTGSAGGIGSAVAQALAGAGALVHGLDVATTAGEGKRTGDGSVVSMTCDVTDPGQVTRALETAAGAGGTLDVLVLAAGQFPNRPLEEWTLDQFGELWQLNVGGVFTAVQASLPYLRASDAGRIVVISSSAVHMAVPGFAPYAATKAALIGFVRSVAAEVAPDGITANVVTPGLTATPAALNGDVAPFFKQVVDSQMIKRPLEADDLTEGVLYLCSPGASMVSGQVLNIDGGGVTY